MRHMIIIGLCLLVFSESGLASVAKKRYRCTPNTQFKVDCNTCGCGPDGYVAYCTKMACPHAHLDDSDVDPAIPSTTVDRHFIDFQKFVRTYNKKYRNVDEFKIRFNLFKKSQKENEEFNAQDEHNKLTINEYSDRTRMEMMEIYGLIIGSLGSSKS